ncbi:MAG: hypothetical protein WBP94_13500, partial [Rhodomicrobiaceae bacterium]
MSGLGRLAAQRLVIAFGLAIIAAAPLAAAAQAQDHLTQLEKTVPRSRADLKFSYAPIVKKA